MNEQAGDDDQVRADTSASSDENNAQGASEELQQAENVGRVIVRFFVTFFTSLIPERPRVVN